ncbi:flagellar motor switch protein FliM [Pseudaminobacter arsenicus]|uniref:Flagellar motor switch protein FliM n=1 Tax=Borborobacter arsenicus TaxID=1851146 RepID=A0A432V5U9_9HYPH|nr:FliM/FliN family flagellar motor switch protein [Pseudaminobacter arsenicus]RUM97556.1 flagellar motor switch protein FliM [Pseudaminobacter arsenicus]
MSSLANPAGMRASILERLIGETGEPNHVVGAARAVAERALPAITLALGGKLAVPVELDIEAVELARLIQARPQSGQHAMSVASSASSPDALILLMDSAAVAVVVSALFGGDPDLPVTPIERELSPTETEVASMVFQEIAQAVNGSGERAFAFRMPLPAAITGTELKKHIIRDAPAVRVDFRVSTATSSGRISLMMPQRVLLKHRGEASVAPGSDRDTASNWSARFGEEIMRSTVDLEASMPLARMTLGEVARLQEGMVIELGEGAQTEARLSARSKTLFVCEFGKLGQNYTVRIRHPFDAGQDLIDTLLPG